MEKEVTKQRNARIELLRILSMLMVIMLHCLSKSGALDYLYGANYFVYWGMEATCIIAVDLFVIISGFFMVESRFKSRKIVSIGVGGVWIYSVLFTLLSAYVGNTDLGKMDLIRMFFPLLTKKFWFVNSYLALYILSPFLNKLIHILCKKQLSLLAGIMIGLFSLRVTVFPITWAQDSTGGMGLLWFITLYVVAAWIRLYYQKNNKPLKYVILYLLMVLVLVLSKWILLSVGVPESYSGKLYGYPSIVVLIEAVALFLAFLNAKPLYGTVGKYINFIAKHNFSAYIIHFAMWGVIFTNILHVDKRLENPVVGILYSLISVVVVYLFCIVVDIVKTKVFDFMGIMFHNSWINQKLNLLYKQWDLIVNSEN